jgi:hypothetical protein
MNAFSSVFHFYCTYIISLTPVLWLCYYLSRYFLDFILKISVIFGYSVFPIGYAELQDVIF